MHNSLEKEERVDQGCRRVWANDLILHGAPSNLKAKSNLISHKEKVAFHPIS